MVCWPGVKLEVDQDALPELSNETVSADSPSTLKTTSPVGVPVPVANFTTASKDTSFSTTCGLVLAFREVVVAAGGEVIDKSNSEMKEAYELFVVSNAPDVTGKSVDPVVPAT